MLCVQKLRGYDMTTNRDPRSEYWKQTPQSFVSARLFWRWYWLTRWYVLGSVVTAITVVILVRYFPT